MDAVTLIEDAIKLEHQAHLRYTKGAAEADDANTRTLFEQLAHWEEGHEAMLKERLATVKMMRAK